MDFHRGNRKSLIASLAAAMMLLLVGGELAAQGTTQAGETPARRADETSATQSAIRSATQSAAQNAEDRPVTPRKDGVEGSPIGKGPHDSSTWALGQTLGALAIVVGLIFLASWLLRRAGGRQARGGQDVMQILARKSISARQQLLLVRLGQRLVLVGSSGGALSTLSEITDEAEVASMLESVQAGQGSFAGLLKGKIAKSKASGAALGRSSGDPAGGAKP